MTQKEFSKKVKEILDDYNTPIGATEGDMIKYKTLRIVELSETSSINDLTPIRRKNEYKS